MEPQLTQPEIQRIRYITQWFKPFTNIIFGSAICLVEVLFTFPAGILSSVVLNSAIDASEPDSFTHIMIIYFSSFAVLAILAGLLNYYFRRYYGKIVYQPKMLPGNRSQAVLWVFIILAGFVVIVGGSIYISFTVIKDYEGGINVMMLAFQLVGFVIILYNWIKSRTRKIWFLYPVAIFLLLLLMLWVAFFIDYKVIANAGKMVILFLLNIYLFQLVYLILLVQTVKQTRHQSQAQIFLTPDLAVPANSLQIIFAILESCQSANTTYLRRFTGLDQETIEQILFHLQRQELIDLKPEAKDPMMLVKTPPQYTAALTQSGIGAAAALTQQLVAQPANF